MVYIVTDTEAGWDCIMAVFSSKESAEDYLVYSRGLDRLEVMKGETDPYVIHEEQVL
jgi:hypothetical protein